MNLIVKLCDKCKTVYCDQEVKFSYHYGLINWIPCYHWVKPVTGLFVVSVEKPYENQ